MFNIKPKNKPKKAFIRWLYPGVGLKRWGVLGGIGLGVIIVGLWAMVNNRLAKDFTLSFVRFMKHTFPDLNFFQGMLCIVLGILLIVWCSVQSVSQYIKINQGKTSLGEYYKNASKAHGPKTVAIGGGTGLSVLLKGLKHYTSNITAAVTVGDDGGSSGRLREEFGVVPVGDIRNCIVALADEEETMETLFNYRFRQGEGLKGHSLGNLLLLAMTCVQGNFQDAISGVDDVLHITGKVLPITNVPLVLEANFKSGRTVRGECLIPEINEPIAHLNILPEGAIVLPEVIEAIKEADVIVLGPGSLYTSVIPNLRVRGVVDAIAESDAVVVYVCNVVTQMGETAGYTASDHLQAIIDHSRPELIDYVIVDDGKNRPQIDLAEFITQGNTPVQVDEDKIKKLGAKVVYGSLSSQTNPYRHDSDELAKILIKTLYKDPHFCRRHGLIQSFWDYRKIETLLEDEE